MGRGARIALSIVVALAALLAINMVFVDAQTKDAEITVAGGEILRLPTGDVQVLDEPAQSRGSATGPAIVLLHCYGCSLHWWDRLAPLLSEHHRVVRVDLLGFGGSEKPKGGYRIADQAATVAAALDQLGVGRAVLVGHSMGFSIAIALATQRRELVSRLVNIDEASAEDDVEMPFLAQLAHVPLDE